MKVLNVLIADDISDWLLFHQQNLQSYLQGYDVNYYMFSSAHDAYNFAMNFENKIDLVITDLQMESMEKLAGEWLVENLKLLKSCSLSKYIIVSSCYDISFVADRVGANSYLRKPAYHNNPLSLKYTLEELFGKL